MGQYLPVKYKRLVQKKDEFQARMRLARPKTHSALLNSAEIPIQLPK